VQPAAAGGGAGGGEGEGQLGFLRNNSQFQVLLQMVQQNPQILQPMLHELGKANPHLLELINTNQEEFLRLINEPPSEGGIPNMAEMAAQMMGCVASRVLLRVCCVCVFGPLSLSRGLVRTCHSFRCRKQHTPALSSSISVSVGGFHSVLKWAGPLWVGAGTGGDPSRGSSWR